MPWRQSRRRRLRKFLVAMCGRRRPPRPPGWQPKPPPTYTRPGIDERLNYWRLSARGWSARRIARRFGRDHHTVLRALERHRVESLAKALAFEGRAREARWLAKQLGDPEVLASVDRVLQLVRRFARRWERELTQVLIDAW